MPGTCIPVVQPVSIHTHSTSEAVRGEMRWYVCLYVSAVLHDTTTALQCKHHETHVHTRMHARTHARTPSCSSVHVRGYAARGSQAAAAAGTTSHCHERASHLSQYCRGGVGQGAERWGWGRGQRGGGGAGVERWGGVQWCEIQNDLSTQKIGPATTHMYVGGAGVVYACVLLAAFTHNTGNWYGEWEEFRLHSLTALCNITKWTVMVRTQAHTIPTPPK